MRRWVVTEAIPTDKFRQHPYFRRPASRVNERSHKLRQTRAVGRDDRDRRVFASIIDECLRDLLRRLRHRDFRLVHRPTTILVGNQRPRDRDALLFATGKMRNGMLQPGRRARFPSINSAHVVGAIAVPARDEQRQARRFRAQRGRAAGSETGKQIRSRCTVAISVPARRDRSVVWCFQASEQMKQRRFAGTRAPVIAMLSPASPKT